ncbi:hypothetical protein GOP47_0009835 [Adiantum capillus-veneris]|uniref:Uncharacterized protein n=1 Tax=Adiantum capillus-veneris TaxID=13818 RepID=A0A9D4ZHL2_ADICA|nr:hypothetical protein GOP47_0009835 [Adiantum capillus-veneris]
MNVVQITHVPTGSTLGGKELRASVPTNREDNHSEQNRNDGDDDSDGGSPQIGDDYIPLGKMDQMNLVDTMTETQVDKSLDEIQDPRLDKIEEMVSEILHEVSRNRAESYRALRSDVLDAIDRLKDAIDERETNVADIQVSKLEEQILVLRAEVSKLKTQLSKLNALLCRLANLLNRHLVEWTLNMRKNISACAGDFASTVSTPAGFFCCCGFSLFIASMYCHFGYLLPTCIADLM